MLAYCKKQYISAYIDIANRNRDRNPKTKGQDGHIDRPN